MDPGDILDRLGLRREGALTQAAQMLYGTRFLPDYTQGRLKLGRFRGTKITGDILDNRQEYLSSPRPSIAPERWKCGGGAPTGSSRSAAGTGWMRRPSKNREGRWS